MSGKSAVWHETRSAGGFERMEKLPEHIEARVFGPCILRPTSALLLAKSSDDMDPDRVPPGC